MIKFTAYLLLLLCTLLPGGLYAQDASVPTPSTGITQEDILPYLEEVSAWQHSIVGIEQKPSGARAKLLQETARDTARKTLHLAFDFARVQTAMFESQAKTAKPEAAVEAEADSTTPKARRAHLKKRSREAVQHVIELGKQMDDVTASLRKAGGKQRQSLTLQQEKLRNKMKIAKAQLQVLQTMVGIFTEGEEETLSGQINSLYRTITEEEKTQAAPAATAENGDTAKTDASEQPDVHNSDGMLKMSSTLLFFSRNHEEIEQLATETVELREYNRKLIGTLRAMLKEALNQGNALTDAESAGNSKDIEALRNGVDEMVARYNQLAASLVPLGQVSMQLESAEKTLGEWSALIHKDWERVLHQLLFRIFVLGIAVLVPLLFSELARRAIQRYALDKRRQRQLNIARRIVVIFLLAIIILMNFITEFGSLATFAGFMTAGLAVALQTVLVSLVAHFFFFGRYGVRAGDRVTVGEVTGDVLHVGMMRIYIRKLDDTKPDLPPSGQIVAFPNSILFQPSGFYKHVEER